MESQAWQPLVASSSFHELWGLVVVDEAHCIIQWGVTHGIHPPFRPAWGKIGEVRALLSKSIPMLATTATLQVEEVPVIERLLYMGPEMYFLNLGNNRLEIFMEMREMKHNMLGMKDLLTLVVPKSGPLKSTMVFFDNRELLHRVHDHIEAILPDSLKKAVRVYHALRGVPGKKEVMQQFMQGDIKILLCTDAAGMVGGLLSVNDLLTFGRVVISLTSN